LLFIVYTDLRMGKGWPHAEQLREWVLKEVQGTRVQVLIGELSRGRFMLLHHVMSGLGK